MHHLLRNIGGSGARRRYASVGVRPHLGIFAYFPMVVDDSFPWPSTVCPMTDLGERAKLCKRRSGSPHMLETVEVERCHFSAPRVA
jgi:hypothetical protein